MHNNQPWFSCDFWKRTLQFGAQYLQWAPHIATNLRDTYDPCFEYLLVLRCTLNHSNAIFNATISDGSHDRQNPWHKHDQHSPDTYSQLWVRLKVCHYLIFTSSVIPSISYRKVLLFLAKIWQDWNIEWLKSHV